MRLPTSAVRCLWGWLGKTTMAKSGDNDEDEGRLARQRALGAELRQVFGRLAEEEVPDALKRLAARLEDRLSAPGRTSAELGAREDGPTERD